MTPIPCTRHDPPVERLLDRIGVETARAPRWHALAVTTANDHRSLRTVCESAWSAHGLGREDAVRARRAMQVVDRIVRLHRADGLLAEQLRFVAHELVALAGRCASVEVVTNGPMIVGAAAAATALAAEVAGLHVLTRGASHVRRARVWPDREPDFTRGIELDEDDDADDDDLDPLPDLRSPLDSRRKTSITQQPRPATNPTDGESPCGSGDTRCLLHDWRGAWAESVRAASASARISPLTVVPFASRLARVARIRPPSLVWLAPQLRERIDLRTQQEQHA